jgi:hypothetical protein
MEKTATAIYKKPSASAPTVLTYATGEYYVDLLLDEAGLWKGATRATGSWTARNRIVSASVPKIRWDESFLIRLAIAESTRCLILARLS